MKKPNNDPTLLGTVQDVDGTTIRVTLSNTQLTGLTFVEGQGYRIGQVGSFVRIPIGYMDLFGIVAQVGAGAVPENMVKESPYGNRWLSVQLIGEAYKKGKFERGISQYPTIEDEVHLVSEDDLAHVYGERTRQNHLVRVGHIAGSESIDALIDINKLVTRHSAIVGTTGSGKSTTVAGLLNALSDPRKFPSARILVIDIHGEYGAAMKDRANIFKINPDPRSSSEKPLYIPYWALSGEELLQISFGSIGDNSKGKNVVFEKIQTAKEQSLKAYAKAGIDPEKVSVDSPIPFSLRHLWYEMYCHEFGTYYSDNGKLPVVENWAWEKDERGQPVKGDPLTAKTPRFRKVKNIQADPEKINYLPDSSNLRNQLESLGAKLRISRFDFLFNPGGWNPAVDGKTDKDLDDLIKDWIGSDKPISILDLSGVPVAVVNDIVGVLLRILYDGLFWARNLSQGGKARPLLIVMEEAHTYLNDDFRGIASAIVQKIVKEGRKYGLGAMIVSQRPSEINSTILSQCGTFFALRLSNQTDRSQISSAIADNLESLTNMLPILRTGEALIIGEAVKLPMRTIIEAPPKDRRPDSQDPVVSDSVPPDISSTPGGWNIQLLDQSYKDFVTVWRGQNPMIDKVTESHKTAADREQFEYLSNFESANIKRIGYNKQNAELQVEFFNGSIYRYYEVPETVFIEFKTSDSKGAFFGLRIKGYYSFSKIF